MRAATAPCRCEPSESVGCTEKNITYIRNAAALLRSPCLLHGGWRPHLLLHADFNLVSGHVRAPAPTSHYTTTYGVGASPIWFGLTGFSSDGGLIKGCVPSGRGANRRRSCSVRGVGARAAAAITADDSSSSSVLSYPVRCFFRIRWSVCDRCLSFGIRSSSRIGCVSRTRCIFSVNLSIPSRVRYGKSTV